MNIPIPSFPKIFAIGSRYITDIFNDKVEITEKVDGSQFSFGKINGELIIRSKGAQIFADNPDSMFREGVEYVKFIEEKLIDSRVYYCEYLKKPKHNVLAYERIPKNHLILFGIMSVSTQEFGEWYTLEHIAECLGIDVVPKIFEGKINQADDIFKLIETNSILGGQKVEGIVVKNYNRPFMLADRPIPLMAGKYVSEKFKEVHEKNWKKENTGKGQWEVYLTTFRTEARWDKAIQHLRDKGELEDSPRDIGALLKEIQRDITEEEIERIKEFLWKLFGKDVLRYAIKGFPEYYKDKLVANNFEVNLRPKEKP